MNTANARNWFEYGRVLFRCATLFALFSLFFTTGLSTQSSSLTEKQKIELLLQKLETSDVKFIRSGTEYTGKEAKSHMQRKWDYAGSRIKTAEQFIEYLGTKSSMTGEPYYVVLKDGTKVESAIWLRQILKTIK